ncbi:CPBP family intramembrane glutamic endopeptidase [Zhouia sp. PK063]|uniref:CPBP family intramembrane glutamic endopeptidase n=1 Tax=Zhouia sp. PK063 TaxID=3373602 RepID=UPI0037ACCB9E
MKLTKYPVFTYLVFTLFFSSIVWILTLHAKDSGRIANRIYGYGIMWCPALATVVTCYIYKRKITDLGWKWPKKYLVVTYFLPLLYGLVAYIIIWNMGWGIFYNVDFVMKVAHELGWTGLPDGITLVLFLIVNGVIGMFASISTALGEEIGWRGFLVEELRHKYSYTRVSWLVGIIWAVWHYPLLIFGDYNNGTPFWYGLICFTVLVVSMSFIYTWYRIKSESLWTGVLLHASHNLFIQTYFTPITVYNQSSPWYVDEFGVVLPVITIILAIYFWSKRKELAM